MIEGKMDNKPHVVLPLLAFAVAVNLFLFGVAYSNASFSGSERALPDVFAPAQISQSLDSALTAIADNLTWSFTTAYTVAKPEVVAFLGLDDYSYGQPRYTALESRSQQAMPATQGAVLGASIVNPEYADAFVIPTPKLIVIQLR